MEEDLRFWGRVVAAMPGNRATEHCPYLMTFHSPNRSPHLAKHL